LERGRRQEGGREEAGRRQVFPKITKLAELPFGHFPNLQSTCHLSCLFQNSNLYSLSNFLNG
jgi:hypothetical protein